MITGIIPNGRISVSDPIPSTFIHGPNTIDIHSWPQCNRHSFMAPIQSTFIHCPNTSTFIHGPNTIDIHSWPQYNRHSVMTAIQSTFIHGPNTIDIHSWPQYNRHSFTAPIQSTLMACSHSCQQMQKFKHCMDAFLFYADAFSMKQMSKRIEGNRKQGKCYSLKII